VRKREAYSGFLLVTIQIPLLRGRPFTHHDEEGAPGVALISESMAKQFWPKGNPVGEHFAMADFKEPPWWQVIGVVADVRDTELSHDPVPIIYFTLGQVSDVGWTALEPIRWVVRTRTEP
jgi:putative ABC transport system permease protein